MLILVQSESLVFVATFNINMDISLLASISDLVSQTKVGRREGGGKRKRKGTETKSK